MNALLKILTSHQAYCARIDEVNLNGPKLRAVLEMNPSAMHQADMLDKERKLHGKRGLLHGIPVLLKDNIATVTSEGSLRSTNPVLMTKTEDRVRDEYHCRIVCSPRFCRG